MQTYDEASAKASRVVTRTYSTSFGLAITLLPKDMRRHIYNLYGLVRVADEIVDTYNGTDKRQLLDNLEEETYAALERQYSANIIVHAFMLTAVRFGIGRELIKPFFASMRSDITKKTYTEKEYKEYIYGSAEVVGLMCLHVFCDKDQARYDTLKPGAQALGSAFQKVNFLRDLAADSNQLQRSYFPGMHVSDMTEAGKRAIVTDIRADFAAAKPAIRQLPHTVRPAVQTAHDYFEKLLSKIEHTPVEALKKQRLRISNGHKTAILVKAFTAKHVTRNFKR
jgi:phytoene synthase